MWQESKSVAEKRRYLWHSKGWVRRTRVFKIKCFFLAELCALLLSFGKRILRMCKYGKGAWPAFMSTNLPQLSLRISSSRASNGRKKKTATMRGSVARRHRCGSRALGCGSCSGLVWHERGLASHCCNGRCRTLVLRVCNCLGS